MKKSIFGTPVVASAILLMVFAAAFATYNTTRQGDSSAGSNIGCSVSTDPIKLFFQDNPAFSSRNKRVLIWENSIERTFVLPNDQQISPGQYEVRTISSDHHFNHRSNAPNLDTQRQLEEEYYLEIDGQRTPNKSTDFTDYYDWRGADGELLQDDDNNIDTIPSVIRDTWQGESLGVIDITTATGVVKATHAFVHDTPTTQDQQLVNSVIPSGIVLECINPGSPQLEIAKDVDGNGDGLFDPELEKTQTGENVTWRVTGTNSGDANDPNAIMNTCAPEGTTLVAGSATVVSGGGAVAVTGDCLEWTGPLDESASASFTFETTIVDFAACDAIDAVDERCSCVAVIHSNATETTEQNPADTDHAAVELALPVLVIDKQVDGNDDGTFANSEEIEINQQFTWKIVASNTGEYDAQNARIQDTAPDGVTFVEAVATPDNGSVESAFSQDQAGFQWDGSIEAGSSVTIEVVARVETTADFGSCDSGASGVCINDAEVLSPNPAGEYEQQDEDDASVTIPEPTLSLEKTVEGVDQDTDFSELEEIEASQEFTWKIVVSNTGTVDAENYRINDRPTVLDGYRYTNVVTNSSTPGAEVIRDTLVVGDNGALNIDINLAAGTSLEFLVTAVIDSAEVFAACDAASAGENECVNTVRIHELDDANVEVDADPNTEGLQAIDKDTAAVLLKKDPQVSIVKTVDGNGDGTFSEKEQITPGAPFEWKIVVQNDSSAGIASDFVISDTLATGVELSPNFPATSAVAFSVAGGSVNANGFSWTGDIAPGDEIEIVMTTIVSDVDAFLSCDNDPYEGNSAGDETCHNLALVAPSKGGPDDIKKDGADVTMDLQATLEIIKQVDGSDDDNDQPGRFSDSDVERITFGTPFTWQIQASNTGSADEPNARVVDALPAGLEYVADSVSYSVDGVDNVGDLDFSTDVDPKIVWTGELKRNSSLLIEFQTTIADLARYENCVTAPGNKGGDVCANNAQVGTTTDPDSDDFTKVAEDPAYVDINREPVLVIEKTVDGDVDDDSNGREFTNREAINADGTTVVWQIVGCNIGTADEPLATIYPWSAVGGLEDAVVYVPGSATIIDGPGAVKAVEGGFAWNGELVAGTQGETNVCVTIQYETSVEDVSIFDACNVADGSSEDDSCTLNAEIGVEDSANNIAFVVADVDDAQVYKEPKGVLTISKTVDGNRDGEFGELEEIEFGVDYDYKVVVTNEGDGTIENAAMRDALPVGVISVGNPTLKPVDFGSVSVIPADHTLIFWTIPELAPGESVELVFPVRIADQNAFDTCDADKVDGAQDDICTNTAAAGTGTSDEDWEGLTPPDPAQVVVKKVADVFIDKTVDGTDEDTEFSKKETVTTSGEEFTYRVAFGNRGEADAEDVTVTTGIPAGLMYVSHELGAGASGELEFDADAGMLRWTGDLLVSDEFDFFMTVKAATVADYETCDAADGAEDNICACSAVIEYDEERQNSTAVVTTDIPPVEEVEINKLVDGDGDGEFSKDEEITIGEEIIWRVDATNVGEADLANVTLEDNLVDGMKYISGSIKELVGADLGVVSQIDDDIVWVGNLPAGETIQFEFKTTFSSLNGFLECNSSDGDAEDQVCTNPAKISDTITGEVLGTDDAQVNTSVPRVLAYTGTAAVNYIIVIGVVIAAITMATAVIAYVTRPRDQFGAGGSGPTVTIVPSN